MSAPEALRALIGKIRLMGFLEGLSFVALMGVGMPLKYLYGEPLVVRITGPVHGILFVALCLLLAQAVLEKGWSGKKGTIVFAAALFPFGPFFIDRWLKREQEGEAVLSPEH